MGEKVRRSTAELERGFGRNRFHVGNAVDAVSPENLLGLGHGLIETLEERFVNGKLFPTSETLNR